MNETGYEWLYWKIPMSTMCDHINTLNFGCTPANPSIPPLVGEGGTHHHVYTAYICAYHNLRVEVSFSCINCKPILGHMGISFADKMGKAPPKACIAFTRICLTSPSHKRVCYPCNIQHTDLLLFLWQKLSQNLFQSQIFNELISLALWTKWRNSICIDPVRKMSHFWYNKLDKKW